MKGVKKMKKRLLTVVAKVIKGTASISSETTSVFGLYQPKNPQALIKSNKKKVE